MRKIVLKRLLWVAVPLAAFATGAKALLNAVTEDPKGRGDIESENVAEARGRGVLVAELAAVPSELPAPGGRIRFGEVWVEERALPGHRFVWFPRERRVGGYRLQFTLAEGRELAEGLRMRFRVEGRPDGLASVSGEFGTVYYLHLDELDITPVRAVLTEAPEARPPEVRFVPK